VAQILQQTPTFGERFGTGLGTGLGAGLQALAQQKMKEYQQQQKIKSGMPILQSQGYTAEEAQAILNLPLQLQQLVVKEKQKKMQLDPIMSQLQGLYGVGQPELPETPSEEVLPGPTLAEEPLPTEGAPVQEGIQPAAVKPRVAAPVAKAQEKLADLTDAEKAQILTSAVTGDPRVINQTIRDIEAARTKEKHFEKEMSFKERKEAAAEKREIKREERIEQHEINKQTEKYYKEINDAHKSARDNRMRGERIAKLNKEGSLGIPLFNTAIKTLSKGIWGAGIDLSFLMTADAQELDKLSSDYLKDIKEVFGAKITESMIQQFLKTVPTLSQSKEGRERIIRNLDIFSQAADIRYDVMHDLIEENGGKRPGNLEAKVEKRANKELDRLAEKFKVGAEKAPEPRSLVKSIKRAGFSYI